MLHKGTRLLSFLFYLPIYSAGPAVLSAFPMEIYGPECVYSGDVSFLSLSLSAILYRLVPGRAVKREFECFFFLFLFSSFLYMWPFKPWRERERERKKTTRTTTIPIGELL